MHQDVTETDHRLKRARHGSIDQPSALQQLKAVPTVLRQSKFLDFDQVIGDVYGKFARPLQIHGDGVLLEKILLERQSAIQNVIGVDFHM